MTREEAIRLLCVEKSIIIEVDGNKGAEKMLQAYDMAIEALQIQDICAEMLESAKPASDVVSVVRCKDCYHAEDDITHMFCVYFHHKVYEDDYCSNAVERREDGEA